MTKQRQRAAAGAVQARPRAGRARAVRTKRAARATPAPPVKRLGSPNIVAQMREREPRGIEQFDDIFGIQLTSSSEDRTPADERERVSRERRKRYEGLRDEDLKRLEHDREVYAKARRIGKTRATSRVYG